MLSQNTFIQVRVVFASDNSNNEGKLLIIKYLIEHSDLPDKTIVRKALHNWYDQKQKSYEAWAKAYPVMLDEKKYHKLDQQNKWYEMAGITATPTLLINGFRLPNISTARFKIHVRINILSYLIHVAPKY